MHAPDKDKKVDTIKTFVETNILGRIISTPRIISNSGAI